MSSCPALLAHIGRKQRADTIGAHHVNVPVHFLASKSRHLLALEVDLCFCLIVGVPSILKMHHKFSNSANKVIWRDQKSRATSSLLPTPPSSLSSVLTKECSTLLSSKLAKTENSESLNSFKWSSNVARLTQLKFIGCRSCVYIGKGVLPAPCVKCTENRDGDWLGHVVTQRALTSVS